MADEQRSRGIYEHAVASGDIQATYPQFLALYAFAFFDENNDVAEY